MIIQPHTLEPSTPLKSVIEELQESTNRIMLFDPAPDVIVFMHDDIDIHHNTWEFIIENEFADYPNCAIIGLGGATGIGTDDIYKRPYNINQLARINYHSNQSDWSAHGSHLPDCKSMPVAVVDGFFMAVRTDFLKLNPWAKIQTNFHCYDTAQCLNAWRAGWTVRAVGVPCTHFGGGTSTKQAYMDWCREHNTTAEKEHSQPHVWMYDHYRDILPLRIVESND